jgi:hypothetical protein
MRTIGQHYPKVQWFASVWLYLQMAETHLMLDPLEREVLRVSLSAAASMLIPVA